MGSWGFLSNHGRVLLLLAHDPGMRLRDIAARLGLTERSAYGIVADLTAAGYLRKRKEGRRNRYQIESHQPLPEPGSRARTVGEALALLGGTGPEGTELAAPRPEGMAPEGMAPEGTKAAQQPPGGDAGPAPAVAGHAGSGSHQVPPAAST